MQTKNITLKEYEMTEPGVLSERDIREVEKLNTLSKTEIFEIRAGNRIKAKQYVGVFRVNDKNIQILPKIFGEERVSILKNLLFMLSYTKKLKIKESDIAELGKIDTLFEVFIYLFAKELLVLLKRDFKKQYNKIEENSSFLKGKLLFQQHIQKNLFNKSKFFIGYEKMDENFLLNIFLHSCCQKLLRFTKSNTNYKLLSTCNFILKDVDKRIFKSPKNLDTLKFHKQNKEYEGVFSLGKMLYFGNSPDFSQMFEKNFFFLFDMNVLFEEFISEFMKNNIQKIDSNITQINAQVSGKTVFFENKFLLKPDISLHYQDDSRIIIDTKYKKLNSGKANNGVSSQDIYQMFVYGMRYFGEFHKENKKRIILLYPDYDGVNYDTQYISEENIHIFIRTINMNLDLGSERGKEMLVDEIQSVLRSVEVS